MPSSPHALSRRALLAQLAALPFLDAFGRAPAQAQVQDEHAARKPNSLAASRGTKLVMLGTGGGPEVGQARQMASHIMLHNGVGYVVDCGLGVTTQIVRAGVGLDIVRKIFITHHHPDHNVEYGPLLLLSWVNGRRVPVAAYGPPPLAQMTADYTRMQRYTTDNWAEDFHIAPFPATEVHEMTTGGIVMKDDTVTVTCAVVQHPPTSPAFGYRFDFADRSIVFSGDTVAVPSMVELARGADVLVHEAMYLPAMEKRIRAFVDAEPVGPSEGTAFVANMLDHMRRDHTPVDEVGRIATEAGVRTLVLSHFTPTRGVPDDFWRAEAAKTFKGEIIVASDLLVI